MDFASALKEMKRGWKIQRDTWRQDGKWINIQLPDDHSKMNAPYIYIKREDGRCIPWTADHADLLADDWETL